MKDTAKIELVALRERNVKALMFYGSIMAAIYSVMRAVENYTKGKPEPLLVDASYPLIACIFGILFNHYFFLKSPNTSSCSYYIHRACRDHGSFIINAFITILNTETNICDSPNTFKFNFE
jgi:hypothetical protein